MNGGPVPPGHRVVRAICVVAAGVVVLVVVSTASLWKFKAVAPMSFPTLPIELELEPGKKPRDAIRLLLEKMANCLKGTGRKAEADYDAMSLRVSINTPGPDGSHYSRVIWSTVELLVDDWQSPAVNSRVTVLPRVDTQSSLFLYDHGISAVDRFGEEDATQLEELVIQCLKNERS
jgi:hypothetical protein